MRAQHLGSQVRRNLDSRHRTVFRDETNFVDLNARIPGQRSFQLFRERTRLGIAVRKSANKPRELWLAEIWCEVNAGNSRSDQQLRETFFGRRCAQRHSIQQYLVPRGAQQQSRIRAFLQRRAQFFPRRLERRHRSHMSEFIQTCKLQQNVQAAYKRACRLSSISSHSCGFPLSGTLLLH